MSLDPTPDIYSNPTFLLNSDQTITTDMTYFTSWDEFSKAVEQLYSANPARCRFVIKYKHAEGKMMLKITDNVVCVQYGTNQLQDVKRLEKLTSSLMRSMATK